MSNDDSARQAAQQSDLAAMLAGAQKDKGRSRWFWRAAVVVGALAGIAAYLYFAGGETVYTYTTAAATKGDLTVLVTATGSIEPTVQVDVSSEQSGTVREVLVDYNSTVRKGEVVARLDSSKLETEVKSAEANLLSAKASVAKAEADEKSARASLARITTLVGNRVSSQQDLEAAQYSYEAATATRESAEASVLSAEAALRQAELNLAKATILSPIDGIVLSRNVDPGATVAASLEAPTLFTIAGDLREMELQVAIDEADVGQVDVGQSATFTVDAFPNERFPAEISSVRYASQTSNDVVTYKGILTVDNSALKLRQGMTATADIVVEAIEDALLIPNAALRYTPEASLDAGASAQSSGGGMFSMFRPPRMGSLTAPDAEGSERTVWVLKNGIPQAVNIEVGASDGQHTVVTRGDIGEGDVLITDETARQG